MSADAQFAERKALAIAQDLATHHNACDSRKGRDCDCYANAGHHFLAFQYIALRERQQRQDEFARDQALEIARMRWFMKNRTLDCEHTALEDYEKIDWSKHPNEDLRAKARKGSPENPIRPEDFPITLPPGGHWFLRFVPEENE